jgi:hypothetical protein
VFTVTNVSAIGSPVLTTTVSPPPFRVMSDTCMDRTLASLASCTVTIQWFPTSRSTITGSFAIIAGTNWSPAASLTGTGL